VPDILHSVKPWTLGKGRVSGSEKATISAENMTAGVV
jgi:hypothetical protein